MKNIPRIIKKMLHNGNPLFFFFFSSSFFHVAAMVTSCAGITFTVSFHPLNTYPSLVGSGGYSIVLLYATTETNLLLLLLLLLLLFMKSKVSV